MSKNQATTCNSCLYNLAGRCSNLKSLQYDTAVWTTTLSCNRYAFDVDRKPALERWAETTALRAEEQALTELLKLRNARNTSRWA